MTACPICARVLPAPSKEADDGKCADVAKRRERARRSPASQKLVAALFAAGWEKEDVAAMGRALRSQPALLYAAKDAARIFNTLDTFDQAAEPRFERILKRLDAAIALAEKV